MILLNDGLPTAETFPPYNPVQASSFTGTFLGTLHPVWPPYVSELPQSTLPKTVLPSLITSRVPGPEAAQESCIVTSLDSTE